MIYQRPDADPRLAQHFVEETPGRVAGEEVRQVSAQHLFQFSVGLMGFEFVSFHFVASSASWSLGVDLGALSRPL